MTLLDAFPMPSDPAEVGRINEGFRRARMMDGAWRAVADEHYAKLFHPDVRKLLPPASVAMNPFYSLNVQQATAYDEPPAVQFMEDAEPLPDDDALDLVITEECWPLMIEALPRLFGLREQVCYVSWKEGRGITYETFDPHMLQDVVPHPESPDQMAGCTRIRRRHRMDGQGMEWTRERWYPLDDVFKIEARRGGNGDWADVTNEYAPEAQGQYPRKDRAGNNLLPFVLFHAAMGSRLFDPMRGAEVVDGTLDASALNTMWMIGMRDGAHPARYVLNAQLQGVQQTAKSGGDSASYVVMMPNTIAQFGSTTGQATQFGEWSPTIKPLEYRQAIGEFVREFAIYAGVSPSDLQVTSGQSGYALALTRDGQRKAQRRIEPSLRRSDRLRFALAAKIHNAAVDREELPEDPGAYKVVYRGLAPTHDEVLAEIQQADARRESGVMSPVEHYQELNPDASDVEAWMALTRAAKQEAALQALRASPTPMAEPDDTEEPETEPPEGDEVEDDETDEQPEDGDQGEPT